ncbi:DUF1592 domain-containing protein [Lignipirellula cremea]|uniref:Planctomycete cytochrome C n=1 Tax=Lignipirellula cremea TaxID=2528010 RepID=A0A518DRH1_9BACT|nr:DUF1592 domain-containing protein [Lignipirellula cremea]QDU94431.1 hypothetical protein Pla8534_22210 [Lignipirellula cremea]
MRYLLILFTLLLAVPTSARADDASLTFRQRVQPILQSHCTDCHGGAKPAAKLDLTATPSLEELQSQARHWFQVLERVEAGAMPPDDAEPLKPADKQQLVGWIRQDLTQLLVEQQRQAGRSKFRRLSRQEYANTLQDVFGIRPPVVKRMPGDGRIDGYDKISAALPFSPAATEGQLLIAEDLVPRMFQHPTTQETFRLWSFGSEQSKGHLLELDDNWNVSFNSDTNSGPLRKSNPDGTPGRGSPSPRKPGLHRLRIHAYGYQTDKPLPVGIYVGHVSAYPQILDLVKVVDIPPGKPAIVETDIYLRTRLDSDLGTSDGMRLIPLGLGVPVPKNTLASKRGTGPGLAIQYVDVEELEATLPGQELLLGGLPEDIQLVLNSRRNQTLVQSKLDREAFEAAMQANFARIGSRLFRRDLTDAERAHCMQSLMAALDAGVPLQAAYVTEVTAMLTSPDFLCVIEEPGPLSDFALASRLSYFLWNSTPDEELLEVARQGKLSDPKVLREQTERLLNDPRSDRFVDDFLAQWLGLWGIDNTTPDKDLYSEYDEELKISSMLETPATFRRMLDENLSVRDFVAPDWAMVNSRLAEFYGIPGVEGFQIRQVRLPADTPYGGIWTQASTLKVTANGTLTSPVKRGVWVAERLLGIRIPPPPSNIDPVDPDTRGAKTLREQLALHSQQGSCKACHARFDPYGFALESFDVMGGFRTHYRVLNPEAGKGEKKWTDGLPVDSTGVTPAGEPFTGVRELRAKLAADPAQLGRGVTRHLLTYATGEPATPIDQPTIDAIVAQAARDNYGLRSLVHGVIQSDLFRHK